VRQADKVFLLARADGRCRGVRSTFQPSRSAIPACRSFCCSSHRGWTRGLPEHFLTSQRTLRIAPPCARCMTEDTAGSARFVPDRGWPRAGRRRRTWLRPYRRHKGADGAGRPLPTVWAATKHGCDHRRRASRRNGDPRRAGAARHARRLRRAQPPFGFHISAHPLAARQPQVPSLLQNILAK